MDTRNLLKIVSKRIGSRVPLNVLAWLIIFSWNWNVVFYCNTDFSIVFQFLAIISRIFCFFLADIYCLFTRNLAPFRLWNISGLNCSIYTLGQVNFVSQLTWCSSCITKRLGCIFIGIRNIPIFIKVYIMWVYRILITIINNLKIFNN